MPRRFRLADTLLCCALVGTPALAADRSVTAPGFSVATTPPAYRAYALAQAGMLVRMTRMLATDIQDGNVAAAQNDYAATHRYLERIRPALALQPGLERRMDAHGPGVSGFHNIEHALFVRHSTQDLATVADRLHDDALALKTEIATQVMPPDLLIDGTVAMIASTERREPYSKTDLWDIEANVEGAREIVAAIRPQVEARDPFAPARLSMAFAATSARLAQFPDGCGFKGFDELTAADKASLEATTTTLARELARLKAPQAID